MTKQVIITSFKNSTKRENCKVSFVSSYFHEREVACVINNPYIVEGVEYIVDTIPMKEPSIGLIASNPRVEFQVVRTASRLIVLWNGKKYVLYEPKVKHSFDNCIFAGDLLREHVELFESEFSKFKEEQYAKMAKEYDFTYQKSYNGLAFEVCFANDMWSSLNFNFKTSPIGYEEFIAEIKSLSNGYNAEKIAQLESEMKAAHKEYKKLVKKESK